MKESLFSRDYDGEPQRRILNIPFWQHTQAVGQTERVNVLKLQFLHRSPKQRSSAVQREAADLVCVPTVSLQITNFIYFVLFLCFETPSLTTLVSLELIRRMRSILLPLPPKLWDHKRTFTFLHLQLSPLLSPSKLSYSTGRFDSDGTNSNGGTGLWLRNSGQNEGSTSLQIY